MMINARQLLAFLGAMALVLPLLGGVSTVNAQGHGPVLDQQTLELEEMRFLRLSPDGDRVVATDNEFLCVYAVESMEEISCGDLSVLTTRMRVQDLAWSPDSTRLVFAGDGFQVFRDSDIWVMDAATGELTNLTGDGVEGNIPIGDDIDDFVYSINISPAWTPDSATITYAASQWQSGQFHGTQIMSISATGGEPTEVVEVDPFQPGLIYFPMHWSADGAFLYYTVTYLQPGDFRNGIYRYSSVEGSIHAVVPPDPDSGPASLLQVSPAGNALLGIFQHDFAQAREGALWVFDLESEELTRLTHPQRDEGPGTLVDAVTFSPDGSSILLGGRNADGVNALWELTGDELEPEFLVEVEQISSVQTNFVVSWSASGHILIPGNQGLATLVEVAPSENVPSIPTGSPSTPQAQPSDTALETGAVVSVASMGVPLHAAPSATAPAVLLLDEGAALIVIGASEEVDGVLWVPVQHEETRTIGFVRVDLLTVTAS